MKLHQTFNFTEVNAIINHPDVFPFVADGMPYPLNCAELMIGRNIFLMCEGGGFCLVWQHDDVYEGHYYFLSDFRGRHAITEGRNALKWCGDRGISLIGHTPLDNRQARFFNRQMGMRSIGKTDREELFAWP